jgi:hypothetical protein
MTLKQGALSITATMEMSVSKNAVGKPTSLAPDIFYGVTNDLAVGIIHSGFAFTGFRGSAGSGLCLSGKDNGCPKIYNNLGLDAQYNLARGTFAAAAEGALAFVSLDPAFLDIKLGARLRYTAGKIVVGFLPSVFIGVTKRDQGNKGNIYVPLTVGVKPTPALLVGIGTGIKGPIDQFGDGWTYSVGAFGQYQVNQKLLAGASLIFPKVTGASAIPSAGKGGDFRTVQVWVGYTQ